MPEQVILNEGLPPSFEWINDPKLGWFLQKILEVGYRIPFIPSLVQFLSVKDVYEAVIDSFRTNRRQVTNNVYSDVWSGNYIRYNRLFVSKYSKILCFQLYMDEVEIANPLGSKKGKHEACVFY